MKFEANEIFNINFDFLIFFFTKKYEKLIFPTLNF